MTKLRRKKESPERRRREENARLDLDLAGWLVAVLSLPSRVASEALLGLEAEAAVLAWARAVGDAAQSVLIEVVSAKQGARAHVSRALDRPATHCDGIMSVPLRLVAASKNMG